MKWAKAEGPLLTMFTDLAVVGVSQDGVKHYMLCGDCERRLGDAENYLSFLVRGTDADLTTIGVTLERVGQWAHLGSVDASKVYRALTGFALKTHLSPATQNAKHFLQGECVDSLRAAILTDTYSANQFAMTGFKHVNRVIPGANPRTRATVQFERKDSGTQVTAIVGGWLFQLFIGKVDQWRREWLEVAPAGTILCTAGRWEVPVFEAIGTRGLFLKTAVPVDQLSPIRSLEAAEDCPCGLGMSFGLCCAGRWLPLRDHWFEWLSAPGLESASNQGAERVDGRR